MSCSHCSHPCNWSGREAGASGWLWRKEDPKTPPGSSHQLNDPFRTQRSLKKTEQRDVAGAGAGESVQMLLLRVFAGSWGKHLSVPAKGAHGQVGLHATVTSPNAFFPKSPSPEVGRLSSQIYGSVCPKASSCLSTHFQPQGIPPAPGSCSAPPR